jgi:hypothetical protein
MKPGAIKTRIFGILSRSAGWFPYFLVFGGLRVFSRSRLGGGKNIRILSVTTEIISR